MMQNKLKRRHLIIILMLIFVWLFQSSIYVANNELSFSVVSTRHPGIISYTSTRTLTGDIVAQDNYFGIVSVDFSNTPYQGSGNITFRIKEVGSKDWYYERIYASSSFPRLDSYPFGFPIIEDSKGKLYKIEFKNEDIIPYSLSKHTVQMHYKYPPRVIKESPWSFLQFFGKKVWYSLLRPEFIFFNLIYALPVLGYLLFVRYPNNPIRDNFFKLLTAPKVNELKPDFIKHKSMLAIFMFIFIDLFAISRIENYTMIILAAAWSLMAYRFKLKSVNFMYAALIPSIAMPFLLLNKFYVTAEKASQWVYLLLICMMIYNVVISHRKRHN